jgi:hypothetical protein
VTLDGDDRDLEPPADVAAFEVAGASAFRHKVSVVAPDGTRADGYAIEEDGIARPEGDGYNFTPPPAPAEEPAPRPILRRATHPAAPLGTVHDGFTKLR